MEDLKYISDDEVLFDVDSRAWELILKSRGGCRCHVSPPCSACCNPVSERELNDVGYTSVKGGDMSKLGAVATMLALSAAAIESPGNFGGVWRQSETAKPKSKVTKAKRKARKKAQQKARRV